MQAPDKSSSVSALLPAYRAAKFIQKTLDSLSAQTWPRLEILVSVDHGDDDTFDICLAHARKDARFRVYRQKARLGWIGNSNFLLQQARGDHALFAFHDDLLTPDCIGKLATVLDTQPDVVLAYPDMSLTHANGQKEHQTYTNTEGMTDRVERARKLLRRDGMWWVPNHGLFRLAHARRIGGLKLHGAGAFSADWPWLLHMSLLGQFRRVPETLCFKYYQPDSLSRSWAFSPQQEFEVSAACIREIWNSPIATREKLALSVPLANWLAEKGRAAPAL